MKVDQAATVDSPSEPARRRRSLMPRFGLRTALIFALLFCLLMGWIGRGFYRVRQDDAAIEAILQAGGTMWLAESSTANPKEMPDPDDLPFVRRFAQNFKQAIGWSKRPRVATVELRVHGMRDSAAPRAMAALERFPEVGAVSLTGRGFDDASIQALKSLPNVSSLTLSGTAVTPAGLAAIPDPTRFHSLACDGFSLLDLLVGVRTMTELRSIRVGESGVTPPGVEAIASLPKLKTLSLSFTEVGRHSPTQLPEFSMMKARMTSVIDGLAHSESLRELSISGPMTLSTAELKAVTSPPNLEELLITNMSPGRLRGIEPGPKLRVLILPGFFPEQTAQAFSSEHPSCEVRLPDVRPAPISYLAGKLLK